jgi:hypothetical protein
MSPTCIGQEPGGMCFKCEYGLSRSTCVDANDWVDCQERPNPAGNCGVRRVGYCESLASGGSRCVDMANDGYCARPECQDT